MKKEQGINKKAIIYIMFFLFVIVMFIVIAIQFLKSDKDRLSFVNSEKKMVHGKVIVKNDSAGPTGVYGTTGKGFFYISKDSVKFFDQKMTEKTLVAYNMFEPLYVGEGEILAVYEGKGKSLHVFNTESEIYNKTFSDQILSVAINDSGFCSLILKRENGEYYPLIINSKGLETTGGFKGGAVFPINTDVSSNGQIKATTFLDTSGINYKSSVVFATLVNNKEDSLLVDADGVFGTSLGDDGEIIFSVKFMSSNSVIISSNKRIRCMEVQADGVYKVEEKWEIELKNEISELAFNGTKGFAIAYGKKNISEENMEMAEEIGVLKYFDLNKNILFKKEMGEEVTYLSCNDKKFIVGLGGTSRVGIGGDKGIGSRFFAYTERGNEIWKFNITVKTRQIIFATSNNQAIIRSDNDISLYEYMTQQEQVKKENTTQNEEVTNSYEVKEEPTAETLEVVEETVPEETLSEETVVESQ